MGTLTFPSGSKIYVDTAIVIYTIEKLPQYLPALVPMWRSLQRGTVEIASSELTLMEVLVLPLRNQDELLIRAYEAFLLRSEIQLFPVSQSVLKSAAQLRAVTNLRTPDAIHAATALATNCSQFLTNDRKLRNVPGLPTTILRDIVDADPTAPT